MDTYFQYAHNLKGNYRFEKFKPAAKNAITSHFIRQLDDLNALERAIMNDTDKDVLHYIAQHLDLITYCQSIILTTDTSSYVDEVDFNNVHAIINLRKVNHIQHPNKLFRAVNTLLPDAGIYIGRLETSYDKKLRIYYRYGQKIGFILWMADFMINRVIPRIPYLDDLYYYITNGQFHSISQAEVLGRLIYCGFDLVNFAVINGQSYFIVIKTRKPSHAEHATCYPIIKLKRIGKNGKLIGVYKFRTMHPYSEYLQDFMVKMNGYNDKGKPANDYRVTRWGKFFRRLWIDELPQLINVVKGEMKLVGLRPISQVRYNEFPEDLRKERIKYKPGCFPPYVALNMPDDKGNIEAERIYIRDLHKHPYITDIRYFLKALYNIVYNRMRSS